MSNMISAAKRWNYWLFTKEGRKVRRDHKRLVKAHGVLKYPMTLSLFDIPVMLQERIDAILQQTRETFETNDKASYDYVPETFPISVSVFKPENKEPYLIVNTEYKLQSGRTRKTTFKIIYSGSKAPAHYDIFEYGRVMFDADDWLYRGIAEWKNIPRELCITTLNRQYTNTPLSRFFDGETRQPECVLNRYRANTMEGSYD